MPKAIESIVFSFPLVRLEEYREALIADRDTIEYDEANRAVGVTRIRAWIQRQPDYAITEWVGEDPLNSLARAATTENKLMARWRGLIRIFSGPQGAEAVWRSDLRHQIFSWATGEEGPESDARILHGSSSVSQYLTMVEDLQNSPALFSAWNRIRTRQGITRWEAWHETLEDREVVLWVIEGRDLDAAFADIDEGKTDLDRRLREVEMAALDHHSLSDNRSELMIDWRA